MSDTIPPPPPSDTVRSDGPPSTIPPAAAAQTPAEVATERAFVGLDDKIDSLIGHVTHLRLLVEDVLGHVLEDREERRSFRERLDALEAIPHTTILPPPNGALDG